MATPITGWQDRAGKLYATEIEADRADAREDLSTLIRPAVYMDDYGFDLDLDTLIANRAAIIAALRVFDPELDLTVLDALGFYAQWGVRSPKHDDAVREDSGEKAREALYNFATGVAQ